MNNDAKKKKILTAKVLNNKMNKSATVVVERLVKHPVNGKYINTAMESQIYNFMCFGILETNNLKKSDTRHKILNANDLFSKL